MKNLLFGFMFLAIVGCDTSSAQQKLSPADFKSKIEQTENSQVVDVRTPGEFNSGHIEGAVNYNINDADFLEKLNSLDKSDELFLYCGSGVRSAKAANLATKAGFKVVYDLDGGIGSWAGAKLPVEK